MGGLVCLFYSSTEFVGPTEGLGYKLGKKQGGEEKGKTGKLENSVSHFSSTFLISLRLLGT